MSAILDFYQDKGLTEGRTFHQVLNLSDQELEGNCDWVQWMFPLPEPSKMQPGSPVATQADFDAIASSPVLKMRVLAALGRYIAFLDRTTAWRRPKDHNHLRITRVLRCLCFCGLNDAAFEFYEYVKEAVGKTVGKETVWYWEEALKRHPAWLVGSDATSKDQNETSTDQNEVERMLQIRFGSTVNLSIWPKVAQVHLWGGSVSNKLLSMPDTMLNDALEEIGASTTGDRMEKLERLIQMV